MPQLLHYLQVDKLRTKDFKTTQETVPPSLEDPSTRRLFLEATSESLDWGTIDVYTCCGSCGAESGEETYREEFVFVQPPLALTSTSKQPQTIADTRDD